jgi:tetratricopeptide (TPR) repeat protein
MKKSEARIQRTAISSLFLSFFAVFVYIILLWFLLKPLAGQLMFSGPGKKGLLPAIAFNRDNAAYHYILGRHYHFSISSHDIKKAISHYRESLSLIPLQAAVWTDLAMAYQLDAQPSESERSLERAVRLNPNNPDLMWEAGTFWLIGNMADKAVGSLKRYIQLMPENQNTAYDLCYRLQLDNAYLLANLVPDSYEYRSNYLTYLMNTNRVEEAGETWKTIELNRLDKKLFTAYVNFLINNNQYEKAETLWKEITGRIDGYVDSPAFLISNYSFENDMLEGGFDWIVNETNGVDVFIDETVHMDGRRSLAVTFDGSTNPDIVLARQVVRVTPASQYVLMANIKTDGITTNGIFMSVQGRKCSGLNKRSETVTGTNFWKELSIDFDVPAQCSAVTINFKRERSVKFDNRIQGTAWLDKVTMKRQIVQTTGSARH